MRKRQMDNIILAGLVFCCVVINAYSQQQGDGTISNNWKKDTLVLCRKMKDHLEINSDAKLLRATIAVSHFDNVMELAVGCEEFTPRISAALKNAVKAKDDFDNGAIPDFVASGLTKARLKRFNAADISQFVVGLPDDYTAGEKYPLVVYIDPYNVIKDYRTDQKGVVNLWWHFDPEADCCWKDFEFFFELIKAKVSIDIDRVYMDSICGNSRAAMEIALKHPDIWAGCMMSTGYNSIELAGNMFNTKFFFTNIHPEIQAYELKINFITKLYYYFGCDDFNYVTTEDIKKNNLADVMKQKRKTNPTTVYFKTRSHQENKSYWLSIEGCEDDNFYRTIKASIEGNKIFVTTENTDAYKIYLSQASIETSGAVEIIENNKSSGFCDKDVFVRAADRYSHAEMIKTPQLAGPIEQALSDEYVVVYQSQGQDSDYLKRIADFAEGISPLAKCVKDTDFDQSSMETCNIILAGVDFNNKAITDILKELPVFLTDDSIIADGKKYQGQGLGCIMIYPNPHNRSKYVLLFASGSESAFTNMRKVFAEVKSENDVVIFQADKKANIKYHIRENFDSLWQWSENADQIIFNNNPKRSATDFQKQTAKAVKDCLTADVAILEPVFMAAEYVPRGENVVLRELFANMQNHWMIKIKVKGSILKQLINKLLVGDAYERRTAYALCGLSFNAGLPSDSLAVTVIENDEEYIIALSASAIKSRLLGSVLTDYDILDESPLLKLLKDRSQTAGPIGFDRKCENIKIF